MLKAVLMVLMAVVVTNAAALGFKWTWDTHAPQKKGEAVNPDAPSEWVEVGSQKTYIIFANPATVRKVGNNVTMWYLYELQIIDEVAGKPFRSVKAEAEYNCMEQQTRTLSAAAYSGNMAQAQSQAQEQAQLTSISNPNVQLGRSGVVNRISDPGKWKPVSPGSTEEILMKFACSK